MKKIVKRVFRRLKSIVTRKPELINLHLCGPGKQEFDLQFKPDATVELVKQSICFQIGVIPDQIDVEFNGKKLSDHTRLRVLGIKRHGEAGIRLKAADKTSRTAFIWDDQYCDPFYEFDIPLYSIRKAEWFDQSNSADSDFRKTKIQALVASGKLQTSGLVVTVFNAGFADLFDNWALSLESHGIDIKHRCLIFPMDVESDKRAREKGYITCFQPESEILASTGTSESYGDDEFARHMYFQNAVIQDLLSLDLDFLFQDIDLVWLRDPTPMLADSQSNIEFMYDGKTRRHGPLCVNTGFMYLRSTSQTRKFWNLVMQRSDVMFSLRSQQQPLNYLLGAVNLLGFDIGILDTDKFVNGNLIHAEKEKRADFADACVLHFSWTGNMAEKLAKYRNNGFWYLDSGKGSVS